MKIWSSEHTFHHPWENVVKAALQKYPNPINPSVTGVDVIDRSIDQHVVRTHRLLISQWQLAPWITKLLGGNRECHASEHSEIDLKSKTMQLRSKNITFSQVLNVEEKLVYSTHPDDPAQKTLLTQEAAITVQNVPLIDYLENMLASKINSNASKGRQSIEYIIKKMETTADDAINKVKSSITEHQ
jgi:hypothetical protein